MHLLVPTLYTSVILAGSIYRSNIYHRLFGSKEKRKKPLDCRVNTKRIPRSQQCCVVKLRHLLAINANCIGNCKNLGRDLLTNIMATVFQFKSFIITMLSKVEVRDLRKLIQISSVMSLAIDDPTEVKPEVLVSLLFYLSSILFVPYRLSQPKEPR